MQRRLDELQSMNLLRNVRHSPLLAGPYFEADGQRKICLCSNNYLGLADHPLLLAAVADGVRDVGAGAGAARLVSGDHDIHRRAERNLAAWTGLEDSLLFASGYAANVGAIPALVGSGDLVVSDELNHASLIDGCRLSRARVLVVPHLDAGAVQAALRQHRGAAKRALVVTESVFSMDGDSPDLAQLRGICDDYEAGLYVDEAHALGVFGAQGAGMCELFHVKPDVLVGTLGKALGLAGAFVAGSGALRSVLNNQARSHVFSTGTSPALAAGALTALRLVQAAEEARAMVLRHATSLRRHLTDLGLEVRDGRTPIVPVVLGQPDAALKLSARLWELGVFVQAIRPPTVPSGTSRLRVVPIATHSDADIAEAMRAFESAVR